MTAQKQADCRTVYKDITLLNRWKKYGDRRFLARLTQLEEIEANDVREDYKRIQDQLRKLNEANIYLLNMIRKHHYESMEMMDAIDSITSDEDEPF